jgi:hypothetical protein
VTPEGKNMVAEAMLKFIRAKETSLKLNRDLTVAGGGE